MIICPAWIPELNSIEHGSEGKGRLALSPQRCWDAGVGHMGDHGAREDPLWLSLPPVSPGAPLCGGRGLWFTEPSSTEHPQ